MATGSIPSLVGPIDIGSSFMMTSIQGKNAYVLTAAHSGSQFIYYWEKDLSVALASNTIGLFSVSGTLDSLTITDHTNTGGISLNNTGSLINTRTVAQLKMSQPTYANWSLPDIFLSKAIYTISSVTGTTGTIYTTTSGTGTTILADNIILVPIYWYFNCTSSGSYQYINTPPNSLINWFCSFDSGITGCSDLEIAPSGWTNLPDCTDGNMYTYCLTGDLCGTGSCKGPCSKIYDDCKFSSGNFVCTLDPKKYVTDTKWWLSPLFIGTVVGIFIFIVIFLILLIVFVRRIKKSRSSSQSLQPST